ncbi:MFS transporter [Myxosarcina sp. GI1]|uniref:MFS transporter n=1 Tax=Myxosarcina sp. GI1 TaxID=1541065 RepID=UPI000566E4CA|nr:MFS transporter [Myxosarcina sp. GI1]
MRAWNVLEANTKRNLAILFFTGLLFWISITLLLPTLPAYVQDVGGTTQQVGLVMGSFAIGLLCSRTWLGRVADRRSRKIVILIGLTVAAIAPICYSIVQSIGGLAAIRAFHGISIASFTIGYSALVVDFAPRQQRGELIGYMNLAVPTGMSIGPALGGFLQAYSARWQWDFLAEGTGYEVIFWTSSLCGITGFVLASRLQEAAGNKEILEKEPINSSDRNFWELSQNPALVIPATILLLVGLVFGTMVAFLPLFVRELDIAFNVGLFYTTVAIASFSVRLFAGKASDRYGRGLFISGSLICYIISMTLLANAETAPTLLLAALAEGAGAGILIPLTLALISDRSYANERGKVFALCMSGFDLGIALAGPVLGALAFSLGYRGLFSLAACLALTALVIFVTQSSKNIRQSFNFALGKVRDAYAIDC